MNRTYVNVTVRLIIESENQIDVDNLLQEMDYNFTSQTENSTIADVIIVEHEVNDFFNW